MAYRKMVEKKKTKCTNNRKDFYFLPFQFQFRWYCYDDDDEN